MSSLSHQHPDMASRYTTITSLKLISERRQWVFIILSLRLDVDKFYKIYVLHPSLARRRAMPRLSIITQIIWPSSSISSSKIIPLVIYFVIHYRDAAQQDSIALAKTFCKHLTLHQPLIIALVKDPCHTLTQTFGNEFPQPPSLSLRRS